MSMKSKRPISPKTEAMLPACRQNASSLWPKKLITDLGPALHLWHEQSRGQHSPQVADSIAV